MFIRSMVWVFGLIVLAEGVSADDYDPDDPECPLSVVCAHERTRSMGIMTGGAGKMQPLSNPKNSPLAGTTCDVQDQGRYECLVQMLRKVDARLKVNPKAQIQLTLSDDAKAALSGDELGKNVVLVLERIQKEIQLKNAVRVRGLIQGLNKAIEEKSLEKVKQVLQNAKTAKPIPESAVNTGRAQKVRRPVESENKQPENGRAVR